MPLGAPAHRQKQGAGPAGIQGTREDTTSRSPRPLYAWMRAPECRSGARRLRTTCERVVRAAADDRNRWAKRARVARRLGLLLFVPSGRARDAGADARLWEAMQEFAGAHGSALVDHVRRQVLAGEPDRARIARGPAPMPSMRLPCLSRVSASWARSPEST